jgi:hypothetical protein
LIAYFGQESKRVARHLRSQVEFVVDAVHEFVWRHLDALATVKRGECFGGVTPQAGQRLAFDALPERVNARTDDVFDAGEAPGRNLGLGETRQVFW